MMDGFSIDQGWALVLGLVLSGVALASYWITSIDVVWRWVVSLLVCALTWGVPLVEEMLFGAWFYRRNQVSHAVDLDGVGASDGR